MSSPYLGEIKAIAFSYPPKGWAFCNGQLLPVAQNQALFAILGTLYGGNGVDTFALPDLQGRMPVHQGPALPVGQRGGAATHTLTVGEIPAHTHRAVASSGAATAVSPVGGTWAAPSVAVYSPSVSTPMATSAVGSAGGGQPHENRAPYLVLNFVIALEGVFPSRY